jgi:hypothetical protein
VNPISVLILRPVRGRHAASPADPFLRNGGDSFTGPRPVTREAVQADRKARHELTGQAGLPTTVIPALQSPPADLAEWRPPVEADESRDRLRQVVYPPIGAGPDRYAAVMCAVSAATGTASRWEQSAAWPRHAIEAATELTA